MFNNASLKYTMTRKNSTLSGVGLVLELLRLLFPLVYRLNSSITL